MTTASNRRAIDPTLIAEAPVRGVDDSVARPIPRHTGRAVLRRWGESWGLLAGRYRIDQELAEGGMSIVFRAWHVALEQPVAIKMMREELVSHSEVVERFLREAQAMALLRGKHAVRVMDVGSTDGGVPFIVLEYLEGRDLRQVLVESGPLPIDRAVALVIQAGAAVAEAHAHGLIHRDLKPDNLFLQTDHDGFEILKVIDYGISKCLNKKSKYETRSEFHLGSPQYMSPEQVCSARSVDARSDVWSLGVVLYELLTGRAPFQGATLPAICRAVLNEEPASPRTLRADLPEALEAIILCCLAKRRGDRFGSVERFVDALLRFQNSDPPRSSRGPRPVDEPPASHYVLVRDEPARPNPSRSAPADQCREVRGSKAGWAGWGLASLVLLGASVSLPGAQQRSAPTHGADVTDQAAPPRESPIDAAPSPHRPRHESPPAEAAAARANATSINSGTANRSRVRSRQSLPKDDSMPHSEVAEPELRYGLVAGDMEFAPASMSIEESSVSVSEIHEQANEQAIEARYALTYQAPGAARAKSEGSVRTQR